MPSWQARVANSVVSAFLRREELGDLDVLVRRARRVLNIPWPYQWLAGPGVSWHAVHQGPVRGEWLEPRSPAEGVILYIHGGGFALGSPATHRPITVTLARRTGSRVFSVDYRLAPEAPFPAALDDVVAAYEWLLHAARGEPVAVAGDSAGGGLALSLAIHARDHGLAAPACVVCFSPWTDLTASGDSVRENDGRCPMFRAENIARFATLYLGDTPADDPRASPVFADLHGLPPLLLQVGSVELLLDDARRVHQRVRAAGGESQLSVYEDVMHVWQVLTPWVPESRIALGEAAAFLRSHLDRAGERG